jgi:hypothetical protein
MSSEMELTEEQKAFFVDEGHYGLERVTLALIYKNGTVVLDYPNEILRRFYEEQVRRQREMRA